MELLLLAVVVLLAFGWLLAPLRCLGHGSDGGGKGSVYGGESGNGCDSSHGGSYGDGGGGGD